VAGTELLTGSKLPTVQRLQLFLSKSELDPERVNGRRLEMLLASPPTVSHGAGVLVIGDSSDRKDGTKTVHMGRHWLSRYGKTDNDAVTVTTVWADERVYYPVYAVTHTPARHFAKGKAIRDSRASYRTALALPSAPRRTSHAPDRPVLRASTDGRRKCCNRAYRIVAQVRRARLLSVMVFLSGHPLSWQGSRGAEGSG